MKFLIIFICLVCAAFATLEEDRQQWVNFKSKHGKFYKNKQEENLRFSVFQQNLREIEEHNIQYEIGRRTYTKGVNQFADFTKDEITSMLNHRSVSGLNEKNVYKKTVDADIPETLDWRDKGAVTDVKNQGICGSCWAFSAIGTLESFNYLKNNVLVSLSIQQLVDCSEENGGCGGGEEGPALKYVKEYGIETEGDYPYEGQDGSCRYNKSAVFLQIKDYVQIERGNEDDLLSAVATLGPISVALDATQLVYYEGGVFTSDSCSQIRTNHAVLAVGYGNDEKTGLDYWLIKNSWGASWGESGYFRIKRGTNECAIAIDCVYPVL